MSSEEVTAEPEADNVASVDTGVEEALAKLEAKK